MLQVFNNQSGLEQINYFLALLSQIKESRQQSQQQKHEQKSQHSGHLLESDDYHLNFQEKQEIPNSGVIFNNFDLIGENGELLKLIEEIEAPTNKLKKKFIQNWSQNTDIGSQQESVILKQENFGKDLYSKLLNQFENDQNIQLNNLRSIEDLKQYFIQQLTIQKPDIIQTQNLEEKYNQIKIEISNSLGLFLQKLIQEILVYMETALNQRTHNILISIKENIQIKFEERIKEILSIITDIPFHFNTFFVKPIKIEQIEKCQSICFNNNDSLIATTVGKSIQIWNFQKGEIQQKGLPLVGHKSDVTTILFSRNQVESFISGGDLGENSIIMWSLQNNTWIQTVPIIQEIGGFRSMILNKKDNKLFTADSQGYIKLWKVDFINKLIEKEYEFPKPFGQVWEISLNDSETSLISCVEDHKIILWKKQSEKNWFIKQEIRLKSQPLRIKFLNDNYFICCTEHDGYLKEFKLKKELFVEKILNKIKLDQQNQDMPSFPIQQNRNIIFVKHNKFIHFLRKNEQGLIQRYQKISFQDMYISGALSNKKQILMIWSNGQYYLFKVGV